MSSTTNTALLPDPPPGPTPLEGVELLKYLQRWFVSVTGMPSDMIRPDYQDEQPNAPRAGVVWMSFFVKGDSFDTFPYFEQKGDAADGDGETALQRQQQMEILTRFYDQGSTGLAQKYSGILRDACAVQQNASLLADQNIAIAHVGQQVAAPVLANERWQYRVDMPVFFNRQIDRRYGVRNIVGADGVLVTDEGISRIIEVNPPAP